MKKHKLVVMYGGVGPEHAVSVKSAKNLLSNIDTNAISHIELFISPKNVWFLSAKKVSSKDFLKEFKDYIFWPVFHGKFGEGGEIQKLLQKNKVKFIGSDAKSSTLAMDKFKTEKFLEKKKMKVPVSFSVNNKFNLKKVKNYPVIVKPVDSGSSVDLFKCKNLKELESAFKKISKSHSKFLIQEFVVGREFTCGVIKVKNKNIALPVTEVILNKTEVFDYDAKYTVGGAQEITPANLDAKTTKKIQAIALKVHKVIGCKDISRTDVILTPKGKIVVLEVNTIPGMTSTSFIPKQLEAHGIKFPEFINLMLQNNR